MRRVVLVEQDVEPAAGGEGNSGRIDSSVIGGAHHRPGPSHCMARGVRTRSLVTSKCATGKREARQLARAARARGRNSGAPTGRDKSARGGESAQTPMQQSRTRGSGTRGSGSSRRCPRRRRRRRNRRWARRRPRRRPAAAADRRRPRGCAPPDPDARGRDGGVRTDTTRGASIARFQW